MTAAPRRSAGSASAAVTTKPASSDLAAIEAAGARAAESAPPLSLEQQAVIRRVFTGPPVRQSRAGAA